MVPWGWVCVAWLGMGSGARNSLVRVGRIGGSYFYTAVFNGKNYLNFTFKILIFLLLFVFQHTYSCSGGGCSLCFTVDYLVYSVP